MAAFYGLLLLAPSAAEASAILHASHTVAAQPVETVAPDLSTTPAAADTPVEVSTEPEAAAPTQDLVPAATATPASDVTATPTAEPADLDVATVAPSQTLGHLPSWVQVAVASGSLYAADSSSDQVLEKLPRYTFLRVIGAGASRLQVQAHDANGTPRQTGWVTAEQVLPSASGTDWLVAARATTLWSSTDANASAVLNVSRYAPLQRLDGPQLNRVQVSVYSADFAKVLGTGWVDLSSTGPALPPETRVAAPSDRTFANRATGALDQGAFLQAAGESARQGQAATGVPASVTVAQAILESDWGRSVLSQDANNYFGMKVMGTLGNDGLVWMPTSEYDSSGRLYQTTSAFRAYKSLTDSMIDHDRLLQLASRYSGAMKARNDPKQFASLIAQEGYSTDPSYADKLVALMDKYNLYQLDA